MKQSEKLALADWRQYLQGLLNEVPVEHLSFSDIERKREKLEAHPVEWIKYFFPEFASAEFAPFHLRAIRRILDNDEWYEVLSWSRELAKSTVTMFCVMYLILTRRKRNVILTSNSKDNAIRLLDPYRINFEVNKRIQQFYGEQQTYGDWSEEEFHLKNGASFRAVGAGQSPRGSRSGAVRPDVLLVDDMDTDEDCNNIDTINKRWDWWEKALYGTRSISRKTLIIFCGNIIAKDCCVVRAGAAADHWDIVNIRDKEGRSSWPQKNTEADIDRVLSKISTRTAQGEYFNNPLSEGEVFKSMTYAKIPPLSRFKFLVEYGDPAPGEGKSKGACTKAVMLMGMLRDKLYIILPFVDHALNSEFIDWYIQCDNYVGGKVPVYRYMENNKLQDPFFKQVFKPMVAQARKKYNVNLYIRGDEEKKTDKFSRIESNLEPLNREGNLILNEALRDNPHMRRLEEQFLLCTARLKFNVDGPDCVEGGYRIIRNKLTSATPPVTRPVSRRGNKYRM